MGRLKVSALSTAMMSDTIATSNNAAGARQDVFPIGGRRGQDVAIIAADFGNQGRSVFRQRMPIGGVVRHQHLIDAADLGCRLTDVGTILARYQDMNIIPQLLGRHDRVESSARQGAVIVFR